MMKKRFFCGILIALATVAPPSAAHDDYTWSRNLAASCGSCHGTEGRALPASGIDALARADRQRLLQKLKDYRIGAKPSTVMQQLLKGYSDQELELIASYFATRP